jgi:hypothetical protein
MIIIISAYIGYMFEHSAAVIYFLVAVGAYHVLQHALYRDDLQRESEIMILALVSLQLEIRL